MSTTTETLKEADRFLCNRGFTSKGLMDLGGQAQASYELGNLTGESPDGIIISLHDYGNSRWTYTFIGHSENRLQECREIEAALRKLPGFEPRNA